MPGKRSAIWNHFVKAGLTRAVCKHCCTTISTNGGSMGNLSRHIRLKHPTVRLNSIFKLPEGNDINTSVQEAGQIEDMPQKEPQPHVGRKMPRKRSVIWNHFNQASTKRAICKYCSTPISIHNGSIGNLYRHLKLRHPLVRVKIDTERANVSDGNISMEEVEQMESLQEEHMSHVGQQKSVQSKTEDHIAQKGLKEADQSQCDPYEDIILYEEKPKISPETSEYPEVTVIGYEQNENSKHLHSEYEDDDPVGDVEYPFEEAELCDTMEPRPWTPVRLNGQRPTKEKKENLVEVCQTLVKTLKTRETRDNRLFSQLQNVIGKLDQTLMLVTQVLVKLNDKFDKL